MEKRVCILVNILLICNIFGKYTPTGQEVISEQLMKSLVACYTFDGSYLGKDCNQKHDGVVFGTGVFVDPGIFKNSAYFYGVVGELL